MHALSAVAAQLLQEIDNAAHVGAPAWRPAREHSTLGRRRAVCTSILYSEHTACRGLRRCVEPRCNLCDSRWADDGADDGESLAGIRRP
jgi:hypothetical protein